MERRRETRGRDGAVISEVDLNHNQLLHRNRESGIIRRTRVDFQTACL